MGAVISCFFQDTFGQQHVVEVVKEEMEHGRSVVAFQDASKDIYLKKINQKANIQTLK